jgi:hypothetical protein
LTTKTPASKVLCPLDFVALAVLPHGQIVGFCGVFWTFDGCINEQALDISAFVGIVSGK